MAETPLVVRERLVPELMLGEVLGDQFSITWRVDRRREDIISGYNVYVSHRGALSGLPPRSPRLEASLYRASTYPGDTDGDIRTESITIQRVETGTRYHVHVRTVFPDGLYSPPSEELQVIPRPSGRFALSPRFSGGEDGYSFAQDGTVPGNSEANDLYLYASTDGIFLASPSRLDRGLRVTHFVDLGSSTSLADHPILEQPWVGEEKLSVRVGHSIGLILTGHRIAKLRPIEIDRSDDTPRVVFEYVYQPVRGETTF